MTGRIYLIRNLVNGKGYVGQTVGSIAKRWAGHKTSAKSGSAYRIHAAIRKYGVENFSITEIAQCPIEFLNDLERHYVESFDTFFENGRGYNLTKGGDGAPGFNHSEETRKRLSELKKGTVSPNKGKKLSPEQIAKMSAARKGKKLPPEWKVKISAAGIGRHWKRSTPVTEEESRKRSLASKGHKRLLGHVHSAETKAKMSIAHMGNKSMTGQKHSEETRRKMSLAHRARLVEMDLSKHNGEVIQ